MAESTKSNLFTFMNLRSPEVVSKKSQVMSFIHDDVFVVNETDPSGVASHLVTRPSSMTDFLSNFKPTRPLGVSPIWQPVFNHINTAATTRKSVVNEQIIDRVIGLLPYLLVTDASFAVVASHLENKFPTIRLKNASEERCYFLPSDDTIVSFGSNNQPVFSVKPHLLGRLGAILDSWSVSSPVDFLAEKERCLLEVKLLFGLRDDANRFLISFLASSDLWREAKIECFDNLYKSYVLRTRASVALEVFYKQLAIMHVIEFMAMDEYLKVLDENESSLPTGFAKLFTNGAPLESGLRTLLKETKGLDRFFIFNRADLEQLSKATPVVHAFFARKAHYNVPFNMLKSIGTGDLKVVKQWLCGYEAGEIAHIHNVLAGETNTRTLRDLKKTEDTFSFSSETSLDNQTDSTASDKFEIKQEADKQIKRDLNISAGANLSYDSSPIKLALTGNVASANSIIESEKTSSNFAREIVNKAVEKVQSKTAQVRSSTTIFENEETTHQAFANNRNDAKHISGIYRWLSKKYKAQVFNYGKRAMYEFVIPEPASFFVYSMMLAAENTTRIPVKPTLTLVKPEMPTVGTSVIDAPERIDVGVLTELRRMYDLSDIPLEPATRRVPIQEKGTGQIVFSAKDLPANQLVERTVTCTIPGIKGYRLTGFKLSGLIKFGETGTTNSTGNIFQDNGVRVLVNGAQVLSLVGDQRQDVIFENEEFPKMGTGTLSQLMETDDIIISFLFTDTQAYALTMVGHFTLDSSVPPGSIMAYEIKQKVFNRIKASETAKAEAINQTLRADYEQRLSTYNQEMSRLLNDDLLQERLSKFTQAMTLQQVKIELKKHCISFIMKEFDLDMTDDFLGVIDSIGDKTTQSITYFKSEIKNDTFAFSRTQRTSLYYPAVDLEKAKTIGNLVQFIEQAFEWDKMAWIFYPYFWANEKRWVSMISRGQDIDPALSSFLQAGSAKVLVAVNPSYNKAVLHYLLSGEPWNGLNPPIIGDRLYIPLHEEVKDQQDDMEGAKAEGTPWTFLVPTRLVHLHGGDALPTDYSCDQA